MASRRAYEAAVKRHIREEQRQLRELERRAKEQAKLSLQEQARLEVETYENRVRLLLSVHKDHGEVWNWRAMANALPIPAPTRHNFHERRVRQQIHVLAPDSKQRAEALLESAQKLDEQDRLAAQHAYECEITNWGKLKDLAKRILAGEHNAYKDALMEFNPFADISGLGSKLGFKVHDATLLVCVLKVKGTDAIPDKIKALTSSGKVSEKPMPKVRFHELYQDYICSCMLRVAREVFALLPIQTLLITASADAIDTQTGHSLEKPVLSVAMSRTVVDQLDFEWLDPSDSMANFLHRGDFKASRKSGAFGSIVPLVPSDLPRHNTARSGVTTELVTHLKYLRGELKSESDKLSLKRRQQYEEG